MSHNITIFRYLAKFTRKHLSLSLFFNKVAGLRPAKRLWRRCFPVNFSKYLRSQKWVTNHCYWICFFYHGWNIVNIVSKFGPIFTLWRHKDCKISTFWKNNGRKIFYNKKYTLFQVWNFLLFDRDILLWNCFEEFGKVRLWRGPRFTPSSNYFTKTLKFYC